MVHSMRAGLETVKLHSSRHRHDRFENGRGNDDVEGGTSGHGC